MFLGVASLISNLMRAAWQPCCVTKWTSEKQRHKISRRSQQSANEKPFSPKAHNFPTVQVNQKSINLTLSKVGFFLRIFQEHKEKPIKRARTKPVLLTMEQVSPPGKRNASVEEIIGRTLILQICKVTVIPFLMAGGISFPSSLTDTVLVSNSGIDLVKYKKALWARDRRKRQASSKSQDQKDTDRRKNADRLV